MDRDTTLEILGLEIGSTIDRTLIREAILAMYASTDAEWVRIESAETDEGLDVLVRISVKPTIEKIRIDVGNRVLRKRIEKWLEIGIGDVVTQAGVDAGRRRIVRHLRDRGYPDPQVDVYLDYQRATNTVVLSVDANLGEPMTLNSIRLTGIDDPEIVAEAVKVLDRLAGERRKQPFDFAKAPLQRVAIIAGDGARHHLIWEFHHIICDGWSAAMVLEASGPGSGRDVCSCCASSRGSPTPRPRSSA